VKVKAKEKSIDLVTRSSAMAEGQRDVLVSTNLATKKVTFKLA